VGRTRANANYNCGEEFEEIRQTRSSARSLDVSSCPSAAPRSAPARLLVSALGGHHAVTAPGGVFRSESPRSSASRWAGRCGVLGLARPTSHDGVQGRPAGPRQTQNSARGRGGGILFGILSARCFTSYAAYGRERPTSTVRKVPRLTSCPDCSRKLRVPDELLGKKFAAPAARWSSSRSDRKRRRNRLLRHRPGGHSAVRMTSRGSTAAHRLGAPPEKNPASAAGESKLSKVTTI